MDDSDLDLRALARIARIDDRINRTYSTSKFEDVMYLYTSLRTRIGSAGIDRFEYHLETVDLMDQLVVLRQNL